MNGAVRILAVDNEPSVTLSMRYIFAGPRYEFTRAENGLEALATLEGQCDRFDQRKANPARAPHRGNTMPDFDTQNFRE